MGPGKELTHRVALTFLDRMVKSNRQFRLGELTNHGHLRDIIDDSNVQSREEALEKRRIVANVLGLAVVTAVNYAQSMLTSPILLTGLLLSMSFSMYTCC